MLRNAECNEYRKCIESIDYVGIMTTVKNLLEFSEDYSRSTATNMFWYEHKTQSIDSFKAENEVESSFTLAAGGGGIVTNKTK